MAFITTEFPAEAGFREGSVGTHSSRTMMLEELDLLLAAVPAGAMRVDYEEAVLEKNVLGKATVSGRGHSFRHLTELYGLEPGLPVFHGLRWFWKLGEEEHPLLALLCALARDPLLRATVSPILKMMPEEELARQHLTDAIREIAADRMRESTIDKVVRNTASSWTQSGHLRGRSRKFREELQAGPVSLAYALFLGYLQGLRGGSLLRTMWVKVLDLDELCAQHLTVEAKRRGYLDFRASGEIMEIKFPLLLKPGTHNVYVTT